MMTEQSTGPIFKIISGPSPTAEGLANASTSGLAPLLSAASKAADVCPHDKPGLLQVLHFRIQVAKAAQRRCSWFGGHIYNRFSGEEPDYIPMSGAHLKQALSLVRIIAPDFVVSSGKYKLRLDLSEQAAEMLRAELDGMPTDE